METQKREILEHLKLGRTITGLAAIREFGCIRLASRISELKQEGWYIESQFIKTDTGKRVKEYWLSGKTKDLFDE